MRAHVVPADQMLSYLIAGIVFVVVVAFRMRRLTQVRPLRIERLWIFPAVYLAVCIYLLVELPPRLPLGWLWCVIALVAGGALGWQRGKTMRITVDPETASLAGIMFLLVLIAVRSVARFEGRALHLDLGLVTVALAPFALGLFAVQRVEMYLRARRLLTAARAA
jgi:NAD/NADP transhydrogenase beta subunit